MTAALRRLPLAAAILALPLAPAGAESLSLYTSADIGTKACKKIGGEEIDGSELYSTYSCRGAAGYVVLLHFEDGRNTVSVGRTAKAAADEPAASEGFTGFNAARGTVEWRAEKGQRPFAIIQRWSVADPENPRKDGRPGSVQFLVVTRLPPGAVCHAAYVDVAAHGGDANAVARTAADAIARDFTCGKDAAKFFGATGRAAALAVPSGAAEKKK